MEQQSERSLIDKELAKKLNKKTRNYIEKTEQEICELLCKPSVLASIIIDLKETYKENINTIAEQRVKYFESMEEVLNQIAKEKNEPIENLKSNEQDYEELKTHEFWINYIDTKIKICVELAKSLTDYMQKHNDEPIAVMFGNGDYIDLVNYLTDRDNDGAFTREETQDNIIKHYGHTLDIYDEIYTMFSFHYLEQIKKYSSQLTGDILYLVLSMGDINDSNEVEIANKLESLTDKQLGETIALYCIKQNKDDLLKKYDGNKEEYEDAIREKLDKIKKEEQQKVKYETIPLFRLDYSDKVAIADNELINILTTKNFNVDIATINTSEEILNNLEELDKMILNYVVFEVYGKGYPTFTDRNVAIYLTKESSSATIHDTMLKEINESLERLQNTKISEGFISEKLSDKRNLKIKRKSALLWLDIIEIDYKSKTTIYKIVDKPFYYDYAIHTGKISEYDREILTRKRKGIDHNLKNTALLNYIVERIDALNYLTESFIDLRRVYDILKITDNRKYTDAKNKVYASLDDLKKNYNFKVYKDNTNTRGATKKIKLTRNGDKPIKKDIV